MSYLETLIKSKAYEKDPPIIRLFNKDKSPVGALYLDTIKSNIEDIVICETYTSEKYYIFINGVAIFFTYYRADKDEMLTD